MELAKRLGKWLIIIVPILLVFIQWYTEPENLGALTYQVNQVKLYEWLETEYAYLYLHLFTFLPVFLLSFDKNVHYYKKWGFLFKAILPVATFFILWDVFFTIIGVWGFNPKYFLGFKVFELPVEEWLFFVNIPFACIFIYECLDFYFNLDFLVKYDNWVIPIFGVLSLFIGVVKYGDVYSSTTFLLLGAFTLYHFFFQNNGSRYRLKFLLSYGVGLIPFFIVNGVLTGGYTKEPIVLYNPEEYFGIRLTSIPLDDIFYGCLLLFSIVTIFEGLKSNRKNYSNF